MNNLAYGYGAKNLRLFGKIFGKDKDYWVCEMEELNNKDDYDLNKYTYFVTDSILNDWIRLPDTSNEIVVKSRYIKHLVLGDLNHNINSNPKFDGNEKDYIRAQIARISYSTTIYPDGIYEKEEENQGVQLKEEENREIKSTQELNNTESWVWLRPCLLNSGNLKAIETENEEDEENQGKEAKESTVERLMKLENDKDFWKLSLQGLQDVHKLDNKDICYGVNVLNSLRWPGAINVAYKG